MKPLELMKEIADELNIKSAMDEYQGNAETYIVYSIDNIQGVYFANNNRVAEKAKITLTYVQPSNKPYHQIMNEIRKKMISKGFTNPFIDIDRNKKITLLEFSAEIRI